MARIRTIKPEFFTHEGLAELSPNHRLFFIGLWTQADSEGRLEDRPRRLKVVIFPYDDLDIDQLLADLVTKGFLTRYEGPDGKRFLQILGFIKHQRPHPKEPASEIPAPPCHGKKRRAVKKNGQTMVNPLLKEGKGKEGNGTPYSPPGDVVRIVSMINELSGKKYSPDSKAVTKGLLARLNDGATVDNCLCVVADRWERWKDKPEMREHFNPLTLFRPGNFEKYFTEAQAGNGVESIEARTARVAQEVQSGS